MLLVGYNMGRRPGSEPWLLPVRCVGRLCSMQLGGASQGQGLVLAGCRQKLASAVEMQDELPRERFAGPDGASRP